MHKIQSLMEAGAGLPPPTCDLPVAYPFDGNWLRAD
jgi:hypothetical protein